MGQNLIVGLDIGTGDVKAVVGEVKRGNKLIARRALRRPSGGLRRGTLSDIEEATAALRNLFAEIRLRHPKALRNIYVNINSPQARLQSSKGIVAVSRADNEIYRDDVDRVIKASQAINLSPNRAILHTITREFVVDGIDGVFDPVGLTGSRLEVNSLIVDSFSFDIKNIERCVSLAGGTISGMIFTPLAAARSVLSKTQKDLGVVLIDIGMGTTGMSVYEENKLLHTAIFPVGSRNVTNDIAIGLKIPVDAAEILKLGYGSALAKSVPTRETVDLREANIDDSAAISRRFLSEIIEVRLCEILELVNNELRRIGRDNRLPGGAVFVGGGAKISGLLELAKRELRLSAQFGSVDPTVFDIGDQSADPDDEITDIEYVTCYGLILSGMDRTAQERITIPDKLNVRNIMKFFIP